MKRIDRLASPFDHDFHKAGFDPDQPRDGEGQWSETGAEAKKEKKPARGLKAEYESRAAEISKKLSDKDKLHIGYYTDYGYQALNGRLRRGEALDDRQKGVAASIDKAIEAAGEREEPWKVYRGMSMPAGHAGVTFSEGMVVELKGYQSTSLKEKVASVFAESTARRQSDARTTYRPVVMEISSKRGVPLGPLSRRQEEREVLLGSNKKYRVLSVEEYSDRARGGTLVKLEAIHD